MPDAALELGYPVRPSGRAFLLRPVFVVAVLWLLAMPAAADEWRVYENAHFGYTVDVPPGFVVLEDETHEPYRREYQSPSGQQRLVLDSQNVRDGDGFEAAVAEAMELDRWARRRLTDERVTPTWASWFAYDDEGGAAFARMISLCDGRQYAILGLTYRERDLYIVAPMLARLEASFKETGKRADC